MAEVVQMPKMSDTMEEGVIAAWHKKVGDSVESGELMAEIETDKATMEYESYNDGVVLHLGGEVGDAIPINGLLAIVGEKGEDISGLLAGGGSAPVEAPKEEAPAAAPAATTETIDVSGINAEVVRMPKMSDTMEEGTLAAWHKKVGDTVESGELMAEIETDKATMEYESYNDGTVLYLAGGPGDAIKIDGVLAIVGEPGADYETLLKAEAQASSAAPVAVAVEEAAPAPVAAPAAPAPVAVSAPASSSNSRVKASPLAKKLAEDKGINLADVAGSGPNGRVTKSDVDSFVPSAAPATGAVGTSVVGQESFEDVPASQMRKAIVKGLTASQFGAPHFYLTMDIDMDKTIEARKSINEIAPVKISFNDIIVKAVAASLKQHPNVNSSWVAETNSIRLNHHVSVGVAMAIEDGLVVPVVKFADGKSLAAISAEVKEFAVKAKSKKLSLEEMSGNTFTVSNLGMFGIEEFTSIINSPESCILAVGAIKQVPVVKDGQIVPGNVMKVTLTCDHRTVDGAVGSAFLQTLKGLVEDPVRILV